MRATSEPVRPHAIQEEALAALRRSRANGHRAGLVVLATGLGKTWLAAFDAAAAAQEARQTIEHQRLLFVAHRAEILDQARETFARVRPQARLGTFTGVEKAPDATVLFGSIQTLARHEHLRQFAPTAFDYIVIDEFHHAAADTYRRILEHFTPRFLLGLTATPERTDGGDLLALCGHNLVHRTDLAEGVRRGFLAPFDYHGVPDDVDYGAIPWSRSKGFEAMPLERAVATRVRAQNALDQWQRHRGTRGLGFCVSVGHADFMAAFFREHGIAAASVHSGPTSAPREQTLADLTAGSLEILFCVDMFNEGVDIPAIDTVLMLRPTESRIIWLQQFGRGLRRIPDKVLRVIDYIGNHQSFVTKVQAMMSSLLGAGEGRHELRTHLHELQRGTEDLPPGCNVTYEVRIVPLLESLLAPVGNEDELRLAYQQFRDEHGRRPTAREMYLNGSLRAHVLRAVHGSWFGLVHAMGDLDAQQQELLGRHRGFLLALETVPVRTCHAMVALTAMLEVGALPGRIGFETLVERVDQLADRIPLVQLQLEMDRTTPGALESCLRQAIERTFGLGARTQAAGHCTLTATDFGTVFDTALPADREAFAALVRELVDWRLAEHLGRFERVAILGRIACDARGTTTVVFEVEAGLELPEPTFQVHLGAPDPSVPRSSAHTAELRANTLVRLRDPQQRTDCLKDQLDAWFEGRAGTEGRVACVVLTVAHGRFWMQPQPWPDSQRLLLGSCYSREAIAPLFGCTFNRGNWLGGVVRVPDGLVLFVSLEKDTLAEVHRYEDRFLSRGEFQWQSQNRTKQDSASGRSYRDHMGNGERVHLFVRKSRKTSDGRGEPFWYCGELEFLRWEGERPITVWWRLKVPLGEELARRFLG